MPPYGNTSMCFVCFVHFQSLFAQHLKELNKKMCSKCWQSPSRISSAEDGFENVFTKHLRETFLNTLRNANASANHIDMRLGLDTSIASPFLSFCSFWELNHLVLFPWEYENVTTRCGSFKLDASFPNCVIFYPTVFPWKLYKQSSLTRYILKLFFLRSHKFILFPRLKDSQIRAVRPRPNLNSKKRHKFVVNGNESCSVL